MLTLEQFASIMGCDAALAEQWHQPFVNAMEEWNITTLQRAAMFLASCGHTSQSLTQLEENLDFSVAELMERWPRWMPTPEIAQQFEHAPEHLANTIYGRRDGNRPYQFGDGWRYRGRGPLGMRCASIHRRCGEALGLPLINQPELLLQPDAGARAAAWYWVDCRCNEAADAGDFDGAMDLITSGVKTEQAGDSEGFADRLQRYEHALQVLSEQG